MLYFDAFAPQKQPKLWTQDIFRLLFEAAAPGGVLVTYWAYGQPATRFTRRQLADQETALPTR